LRFHVDPISHLYFSMSDSESGEEAYLSKQYGEASEAPSIKKKADTELIEGADPNAIAETAEIQQKKKRRVFLPTDLTGPRGMIKIRNEFPSTKSITLPKKGFSSSFTEAQYAKNLIDLYKEWASSLFPNLSFEDLLLRVETFGSQQAVRNLLGQMRQEERSRMLAKKYGEAGAQALLDGLGLAHDFNSNGNSNNDSNSNSINNSSNVIDPIKIVAADGSGSTVTVNSTFIDDSRRAQLQRLMNEDSDGEGGGDGNGKYGDSTPYKSQRMNDKAQAYIVPVLPTAHSSDEEEEFE